jgi:hypothetical protein
VHQAVFITYSTLVLIVRGTTMKLRQNKLDRLPEYMPYRDEGCDLAPSCLACPFEVCRYDALGGIAGLLRSQRDQAIARRKQEGLTPTQLANEFNVSIRSIYRVLGPSNRAVA